MTGDVGGATAMAKSVGYPLAIATKLILNNIITTTGSPIPVTSEINDPIKRELSDVGLVFDSFDG